MLIPANWTDLVEQQDEIDSKGDEEGQEPQVIKVARKIILHKKKQHLPMTS